LTLTFSYSFHSKHRDKHTHSLRSEWTNLHIILLRLAAAALCVYFRRKTPEKTHKYRCYRWKQYRNESVA